LLFHLLANREFGTQWRHLSQPDVRDELEKRAEFRTAMWLGLLRIPGRITYEEIDGQLEAKFTPEAEPPPVPTWRELWGKRFQEIASDLGPSPASGPQAPMERTAPGVDPSAKRPWWQFGKK
jgi:hypothetical protein